MADKELLNKLRLDPSKKILIVNAPEEYKNLLSDLDYDIDYNDSDEATYDFVQVFASKQDELVDLIMKLHPAGKYDCLFWASYPKSSGDINTDIKRDTVWSALSCAGMSPVTQVALDETWTAMRGRPNEAVGT